MPKKSEIPLHKHTLNLYEGTMERLAGLYPDNDPSYIAREILWKHCDAKEREHPAPRVKLELEG